MPWIVHISTPSTATCVPGGRGGESGNPGTGDTHPTQGAGTLGGRGIRALSRPARPPPRACGGHPRTGRAPPVSTDVRAGGDRTRPDRPLPLTQGGEGPDRVFRDRAADPDDRGLGPRRLRHRDRGRP